MRYVIVLTMIVLLLLCCSQVNIHYSYATYANIHTNNNVILALSNDVIYANRSDYITLEVSLYQNAQFNLTIIYYDLSNDAYLFKRKTMQCNDDGTAKISFIAENVGTYVVYVRTSNKEDICIVYVSDIDVKPTVAFRGDVIYVKLLTPIPTGHIVCFEKRSKTVVNIFAFNSTYTMIPIQLNTIGVYIFEAYDDYFKENKHRLAVSNVVQCIEKEHGINITSILVPAIIAAIAVIAGYFIYKKYIEFY